MTVGLKATWDATGGVVIADKSTSTSILEIDAVNKRIETREINATLVESTTLKVGGKSVSYILNAYKADAGTAGDIFVVAPVQGTITKLSVVNYVANTTTKTVLTSFIGVTQITHPALEVTQTQAAGTASAVTPTATNVVAAGDVIKITSDGATDAVMPINVTVTVQM